jgi:acyl-homoserine-lactone acylase
MGIAVCQASFVDSPDLARLPDPLTLHNQGIDKNVLEMNSGSECITIICTLAGKFEITSAQCRSRHMKIIKVIFICLLIAAAAIVSSSYLLKQEFGKSVDEPSGTLQIRGLRDVVVIRRDGLGVPFIEANNEEDLYFATGYVTASDRLWQMTSMTMAIQGRLSEILGDEGMKIDLFMRTLGVGGIIDDTMKKMDSRSLSILEGFSRGVNAYLDTHRDLPAEFVLTRYRPEPWQPKDSLYVFAMLSLTLSFNFIEELDFLNIAGRVGYDRAAYLFPIYPDEGIPFEEAKKLAGINPRELNAIAAGWNGVLEDLRRIASIGLPASNNWAVAGVKTKSGKSIICNDTHLDIMMPNAWMLLHQKCPGLDIAGVAVPGIPLVVLGYNGRFAWGATMVMADNQDLFIEQLKTIDGKTHYLHQGQWVPAQVRRETFNVRGGNAVVREIKTTVHGPLLNDALAVLPMPPMMPVQPLPVKSAYGIALSWGIGDGSRLLAGFMKLGTAKSIADVRLALSTVESIYLNIIYGDTDNIGWQVTGKYPIRKKGTGQLPSPGWTGEYDWTGFLPATVNPHSENPASGYIATANNRTVDKNYPYHLTSSWYTPERSERLNQVLGPVSGVTGHVMRKLQFDHYSLMAKKVQDLLFKGESARRLKDVLNAWNDDRSDRAIQALKFLDPRKFNAVMDKDSPSAAVMGAFIYCAAREAFLDELGPDDSIPWLSLEFESLMGYSAQQDHILGREESPFWDNIRTKEKETKWSVLAEALNKALLLCEDRMGGARERWKWGSLHTYRWAHDFTKQLPVFHGYFNRGPYPASGDPFTLDVASHALGGSFNVVLIPAMRLVVDFAQREPAMLIGVPGQSGNPSSGHYGDMLDYWLNGRNHPLPFGKDAVEKQYGDVLTLKPQTTAPNKEN